MGVKDDGLILADVGSWSEDKYKLVAMYASMFSTSMKKKWNNRVYVDLFSGPGYAKIRETGRIVETSPMLALRLTDPFDFHIFCEKESDLIEVLNQRCSRDHPDMAIDYIEGDVNKKVPDVLQKIPAANKTHRVLSFCFADPFSMGNLRFSTIRELSSIYIDFLVLIPSGMDAARNLHIYIKQENKVVENFLGEPGWRERWNEACKTGQDFEIFITDSFCLQMKNLGYLYDDLRQTRLVRSTDKNLPLYRLAFFSRHEQGQKFWKEALRYSNSQIELNFDE